MRLQKLDIFGPEFSVSDKLVRTGKWTAGQ